MNIDTFFNQFWKVPNSQLIFIHEFIDYSKLFESNPYIKYYLSCKLAADYYSEKYDNVYCLSDEFKYNLDKRYYEPKIREMIVSESDSWRDVYNRIINDRPGLIYYFQKEICAYEIHSELTEVEFLCEVFGIKFYRTSDLFDTLIH